MGRAHGAVHAGVAQVVDVPAVGPVGSPDGHAAGDDRHTEALDVLALGRARKRGVLATQEVAAVPGHVRQERRLSHRKPEGSHGDHTGSNEFFGASVESVVHENTKANMARMDAFKGD